MRLQNYKNYCRNTPVLLYGIEDICRRFLKEQIYTKEIIDKEDMYVKVNSTKDAQQINLRGKVTDFYTTSWSRDQKYEIRKEGL